MEREAMLRRMWYYMREKMKKRRRHPNLNGVLPSGETLLTAAIVDKEVDSLRFFLCAGADTEAQSNKGTPLMRAIALSSLDSLQMLLEAGANPNTIDRSTSLNPLQAACEYGSVEAVRMLVNYGADPNNNVCRNTDLPLSLVMQREDQSDTLQILGLLLNHGADVNRTHDYLDTPFVYACRLGNLSIVQLFLEFGGNLCMGTCNGIYPLEMAMAYGHCDVVDVLAKAMKKQVLTFQQECVLGAIYGNCLHCLQLCLDAGLSVSDPLSSRGGITPLQLALKSKISSYLGGNSVRYLEQDFSGPLSGQRIQVARKLVEVGANLTDIWQHDIVYDHPQDELPYLLIIGAYGLQLCNKEMLWYEFRRMTFYGMERSARLFCLSGYTPTDEDCEIAVKRLNSFRDKRKGCTLQACLATIRHLRSNPRTLINCCTLVIRERLSSNVIHYAKFLPVPDPIRKLVTLENETV